MATLTGKAYLYRYQSASMDKPMLIIFGYEASPNPDYIFLGTREIEFTLPKEDFTPERVAALRAKRTSILEEASAEVAEIEDKIQKLLCIEGPSS